LIDTYGENILFVHIPQKDEVISGQMSNAGKDVNAYIGSIGGVVFDGYTKCQFDEKDYFLNDGHPNAIGYKKVSECVRSAIKLRWRF
jgi:Na+/H+ antiporter NhaA